MSPQRGPRTASNVLPCSWSRTDNSLQWRHNEHDGVSNHQPHDCLLNRLFRRRSKKTSKLRVAGLCEGNSPVVGEFPAQRASNAENVVIHMLNQALVSVFNTARTDHARSNYVLNNFMTRYANSWEQLIVSAWYLPLKIDYDTIAEPWSRSPTGNFRHYWIPGTHKPRNAPLYDGFRH